jgi:hypothetical protein
MSSLFDCNLMPIFREEGQDFQEVPGLFVAQPPRRMARGRGQDHLVLHLDIQGNVPFDKEDIDQILKNLSRVFYDTPGSTTYALRTVADELNRQLSFINSREKAGGLLYKGLLTQVVIREGQLILAQSGLVKAFLITENGVQEFYCPDLSGNGLGFGEAVSVCFNKVPMTSGSALLLSSRGSPAWKSDLLIRLSGHGPESMRRRLFDRTVPDLNAVLVHMRQGKGKIQVIPFQPVRTERVKPLETQPGATGLDQAIKENDRGIQQTQEGSASSQETVQASLPVDTRQTEEILPGEGGRSPFPPGEPARDSSLNRKKPQSSTSSFLLGLAALGTAIGNFFNTLGRSIGKFLGRLFPDELFELSNLAMAFIAIAVPVIIVTAAGVVYYQLGRAEQGRALYIQAGEMSIQALDQADPIVRRNGLIQALQLLKQVDSYGGISQEQVNDLRSGIYQSLDQIDQIIRIDYQNALLDPLEPTAHITRMVNSFDNLYMLDSSTGNILRALETAQGYQLDRSFHCGPEFSMGSSGPLVGVVLWPESYEPEADVVGMDASGNLLFCRSGLEPIVSKLPPPEIGGFSQLTGLVMDRGKLYVLDPTGNAVWVYPTPTQEELSVPYLFFDEQVPEMQDVIDIAVNFDELYLLHADGHLTLCFADVPGVSQAHCVDPQPLRDFRQGRENQIYEPDRPFSQLYSNPSPDPSIFMLEPVNQAITHFSFRKLGFLQEYSPSQPFSGNATAFTIRGIERMAFLALGNQVYFGVLP